MAAETWNPDQTSFPKRKDLPRIEGAPEGAAWFWGKDDALGRLNLLTPSRILAASKLIKTGELVPVNMPLNHPETPAFGRKPFKHTIEPIVPGICFDDLYDMNTQSGTQWDGFRHFAHMGTGNFYNGVKADDISGPDAGLRNSIHYVSEHGIAGRGILIDFAAWAESTGRRYDPWGADEAISLSELRDAAEAQGIDIRPAAEGGDVQIGDMLFVRSGWTKSYFSKPREETKRLGQRHSAVGEDNEATFGGVEQSEEVKDWLHDCYFATVAGDAPAFEKWPGTPGNFLHEYILALWGCPIGEMLDLEKLAETCRKNKRWTFFFSSSPANMPGGVASHVNGTAIF